DKTILDIAWGGVHVECGADGFGGIGVSPHKVDKPVGLLVVYAAVDQFLFNAAEFRKFREYSRGAKRYQQVGSVADGRVCRNTGKSIRASALESHDKLAQWRGFALQPVRLNQAKECAADRMGQQVLFSAFLLLFQDDERFRKIRILLADFFFQQVDLRVLTTEAKHRGSGHVGIVDIACNKAAQGFCILSRAPTPAFVGQEFYSVNILE